MKKVLMVVLLAGAVCLAGLSPVLAQVAGLEIYSTPAQYEKLTGNKIGKFNEAPMLKTRVAAGEIPFLVERLPEEPLVVKPLEEIGQYGGLVRLVVTGSHDHDSFLTRRQSLFLESPDLKSIVPNIAKGWDLSEDSKTLTVYLRKGMKWSDGYPFTADDFLFWYEDIILNDELTPATPGQWAPGGEIMKVKKVDDYTVQFQFAVPYPRIIEICTGWVYDMAASKHYLKKYHIKYNPKADEIAKEEGYDHWWQCFLFHRQIGFKQRDVNLPSLDPWVIKHIDAAGNKYFERNPFYWKVDVAGNQLPYIDEHMYMVVENIETLNMKIISGEISYALTQLSISEYPLYKKYEREGDYRATLFSSLTASQCGFIFNYTHKDPILKQIFNDIRFRQAASLAINRDEINESVFFGKTTPYNCPFTPDCSFYEDWMGKYYVEYSPQEANKLLDEMGLKWDKDHKYRLRPDGKTLSLLAEYVTYAPHIEKVVELVKEYWEKVGIKVTLKSVHRGFYLQQLRANEADMGIWAVDGSSEMYARRNRAIKYCPPWHWPSAAMGGVEWYRWYETGGKEGEEPPEEIKRLFKLTDEWLCTPRGTEEYLRLGKEIITINTKGLYTICTVGLPPKVAVIKNNLKNTPPEGVILDYDYNVWKPYRADQWFFKK